MVVVPLTVATGKGFTVITAVPVSGVVHDGLPLDDTLTKVYVRVAVGAPAFRVAVPDPFKVIV
jgi:hypothetical protein